MVRFQVVNVVATASVNQSIDFDRVREYNEILHDSNVYGGRVAYFKNKQMQGKVSIFLSGKMISVGTKSEAQAQKELLLATKFLVKKGLIKDGKLQPKTQNMVITVDFERPINLEEMSEKNRAIYEPEQFPGAILRIKEPCKTSILVFASGKIVITGLTGTEQIEPIIQEIKKLEF